MPDTTDLARTPRRVVGGEVIELPPTTIGDDVRLLFEILEQQIAESMPDPRIFSEGPPNSGRSR